MVYFNQGFKIFLSLAVMDYFKLYLKLEPSYSQYLISLVSLPWSFKILYGLVADNIPICGSRRKSYIIINGVLQFASMIVLAYDSSSNEAVITLLLIFNSLSGAFVDVVVDALMVTHSRIDPKCGSEEL